MGFNSIGILHYSGPPVVGGVESVIYAQSRLFIEHGYPVTVIAGRGNADALPAGSDFVSIPMIDSQTDEILKASHELAKGHVPLNFNRLTSQVEDALRPVLNDLDAVIIHNVLTKHFNLPLTAALKHLEDHGELQGCIAWCHDLTWTSVHSRSLVHPGYPWDLLRTGWPGVTYVAVSEERRRDLAGILGYPEGRIQVIYNGVNPEILLGISKEGRQLMERLGMLDAGLILLLPVRVTQAKNIEYALRTTAALKDAGCRPLLVVTGPPDPHDSENMNYFQSLLKQRDSSGLQHEARFVYESGLEPGKPYQISDSIVAELFRISDILFMPSHREGFGMPVLEAGLIGLPVASSSFPAAIEIGDGDVLIFDPESESPENLAQRLIKFSDESPTLRLRRRVRQDLTWEAIFERQIRPLVDSLLYKS